MHRRAVALVVSMLAVATTACSGDGGETVASGEESTPATDALVTRTTAPGPDATAGGGAGLTPAATDATTSTVTATPSSPPAPPAPPSPGPAAPPAPRPPEATGTPARGVLVTGEGGTPLAAAPGGAPYGRLRANVALSYDRRKDGWARVLTPCENRAWAPLRSGEVVESVDVVIDPGHGAGEPGAVGPTGLTEAELNMDVARRTVAALRRAGVSAALARTHDYRVTLVSRVAIAKALRPAAFVSIHHNAAPDVTNQPKPGSEMYYQIASAESKRLAGLLYVETIDALSAFPAQWAADTDAGAKVRRNLSGGDYYGILRHSFNGGVTGVLAEMAFISNPSEEALLLRNDVRDAEAAAVTRALVRFLRTDDQGAGFVDAYARNAPAGGGGGAGGCVDPG